jgi:GNAT superfamily N-acetyltransferase
MSNRAPRPPRARVRLRLARAEDRPAIRAFLDRLSPDTVKARYLSPLVSLTGLLGDREVVRLLERSTAERVVLLAVDGSEVRGIGEFVKDAEQAELALVVEDDFQGRGIGGSLLRELEQRARDEGILAFTGDVAYGNWRMTALLRRPGRKVQVQPSVGSMQFSLPLAA